MNAVNVADISFLIAKAPGSEVWQTIVDLVHNVSEVMLANLPSFWKIGKSYIDGKFRKVQKGMLYNSVRSYMLIDFRMHPLVEVPPKCGQ